MRFPSLQSLAGGAWQTFRRFPIAILLTIKATAIGICWTHLEETGRLSMTSYHVNAAPPPAWYWNAIVSCYLGMLLSVAATKWVEARRGTGAAGDGRRLAVGLQAGVLIFAALYYLSLPPDYSVQMVIRTVVLALGLHWLIAVIGFGGQEVNGFWLFNKRLFLRMLTTFLYSIVLYVGVALAFLAIDKLFNADVHWEVYQECWWVFGGLFSVWFFLSGFPKTFENPVEISDYPRGLKIFTQYVLLSLVMIYLLILYAYMFKIVFTAHWPAGWVAWMVMVFSVAGILSLLLIYPLRNEENNTWIRGYSTFYYVALLPLIALLFCAIYKRVAPYGITEQRYFLMALASWLLFITLYFLFSRKKDIRLVPLSLCILAFLSVWGPWGAFAVSLKSQRRRLEELLTKNGLMADGKVVAVNPTHQTPAKDRKAISSITEYIVDQHGYQELQPLLSINIDSMIRRESLTDRWQAEGQTEAILHLMHVNYTRRWETDADSVVVNGVTVATGTAEEFNLHNDDGDNLAISTEGAQYVLQLALSTGYAQCDSSAAGENMIKVCVDTSGYTLTVSWAPGGAVTTVDLDPLANRVRAKPDLSYNRLSQQQLTLPFSGGQLSGKFVFSSVSGSRTDTVIRFHSLRGALLISRK
jgi:hypothetical protein